jgi:hypothetical protein
VNAFPVIECQIGKRKVYSHDWDNLEHLVRDKVQETCPLLALYALHSDKPYLLVIPIVQRELQTLLLIFLVLNFKSGLSGVSLTAHVKGGVRFLDSSGYGLGSINRQEVVRIHTLIH